MIGEAIAHYRITAPIGRGGMGEVYRARDTKLDRDVAIKVLPEAFARDPERMARFEREAKVLASLNHPNIAHIYGVEERALIMEFVDGESPKGPMAFDEAWKIASQMADALEYAHEKGVVHRDLKPANVKVTPEGVVKLLDFGLAKAYSAEADSASDDPENSPTLTMGATVAGTIMGTPAYMAPEQAKGKRVDKRADIWSWGVVFYELLTGERLFKGDDAADSLAQVLTKEPDLDRVPITARRLLQSCLEKDGKKRLRDIGDAWRQLDQPAAIPPAPSRSRLGIAAWIAGGVLLVALSIVSFLYLRQKPQAVSVLRYTIAPPENTTRLHSFAISPDGRHLAIAADVSGQIQLWLRAMDAFEAQPMAGTEGATYPFWSPDSRNIGFFAQGKLKRIAVSGGPAQSLCDAPDGHGGSWNRDEVILFSPNLTALQRIPAIGGVPVDVIRTKSISGAFPAFLPDGHRFLYEVIGSPGNENGIHLRSLDGREDRRVLPDQSTVALTPGRLLFIRQNTLMAQSFDANAGQVTGDVLPVAEGVYLTSSFGSAPVTVSESGVLVYESGIGPGSTQMAWYDRGGKLLGTVGAPGAIYSPAISPDQKSIMFQRAAGSTADLWLWDLIRGNEQRITANASINGAPVWSPKGDRVVFFSSRGGTLSLYQKTIGGNGPDEPLYANGNTQVPTQWSRDGRFLIYDEFDLSLKPSIWVLPMSGSGEPKASAFRRSEFSEHFGQLSPDSRWMAYSSDESGRLEVYVRPFPPAEGQWKISVAGGAQPRWTGDGKELFFVGADGKMMAVFVNASPFKPGTKPSLDPDVPRRLFETHLTLPALSFSFALSEYDVTADGKRFLLLTPGAKAESGSVAPLSVVVNWDAGLKK